MKIELEQVSPHEIEKRSFEIITEELNGRTFPEDQELVVKRCIHTSADFDYADNLCFSEHAVAKGIEAIREGACIVTDTQMARSGINKKVLGAATAVKRSALCQTKMLRQEQKKPEAPARQPAWKKRRSWIKS